MGKTVRRFFNLTGTKYQKSECDPFFKEAKREREISFGGKQSVENIMSVTQPKERYHKEGVAPNAKGSEQKKFTGGEWVQSEAGAQAVDF